MNVEKTILEIQTCSASVGKKLLTFPHTVLCGVSLCLPETRILFSACDCNLEGAARPSCDPETGDCICRVGVSGIFCDECAAGYSMFPICKKCHLCTALWTENISDVQKAAQRMKTFLPRHGSNQQFWQQILDLHSKLGRLGNLTSLSLLKVDKLEKLFLKIR